MKVRMITTMAGPDGTAVAGSVVDVPSEKAEALVHGGFAMYVVDVALKPTEEVAVRSEPPETTMGRSRGRPRKPNL